MVKKKMSINCSTLFSAEKIVFYILVVWMYYPSLFVVGVWEGGWVFLLLFFVCFFFPSE